MQESVRKNRLFSYANSNTETGDVVDITAFAKNAVTLEITQEGGSSEPPFKATPHKARLTALH